ncbi:hypothetical protein [Nocardia sp. NPDC003963]
MAHKITVTRDAHGASVVTARCKIGEGHVHVLPNGTASLGGDFAAPLPIAMIGPLRAALNRAKKIAPQQPAIPDGAKFTARIVTDDTIDCDQDLMPADIVITVDNCPGSPPIATYSCSRPADPIGKDPDDVLEQNGWRPYGPDQLDTEFYRVVKVERIWPLDAPSSPAPEYDLYEYLPETYDRVVAKLADDPDAPLGGLEARSIPQRWFAGLSQAVWGSGEPFVTLYEWATNGEKADWIRSESLIEEAQRMRSEILDPAYQTGWQIWDEGGTPDAAAAVVDVLIGYLRQHHTSQTVAQWLYANTDLRDYPDNAGITDNEARLIALGWAEDRTTLQHWGGHFIDTDEVSREELLTQARHVRAMHQLNDAETWPHAGERGSTLVAMAALIRYLERLR